MDFDLFKGAYFAWKATAMGKNYVNGKTFLEKRYKMEKHCPSQRAFLDFLNTQPLICLIFLFQIQRGSGTGRCDSHRYSDS